MAVGLLVLSSAGCGEDVEGTGGNSASQIDNGADTGIDVTFTNGDDATPAGTANGGTCITDADCAGGSCLTDGFEGGYCSSLGCGSDTECGLGEACISDDAGTYCAAGCLSNSGCRNGYACEDVLGSNVNACIPIPVATGEVDGGPCQVDEDCRGGACIEDADWLDGYCTTVDCENFEDCASDGEDNRCLLQGQGAPNFCVRICTGNEECRDGYVCTPIGQGVGYCGPNPFTAPDVDPDDYPFPIVCDEVPGDGFLTIDYEIAEDTTSYMITPFDMSGQYMVPQRIDLPSGNEIDLLGDNSFQLAGAQLFGWLNPTIVPAISAFDTQLEHGAHGYVLESDGDDVCHYLLQESTPGTTIDVNVYLVGITWMNASTADENEHMAAVLGSFDEIYEPAGVEIGEVRFYDIEGDDAERYSVLRDDGDVARLVTLSELPGTSYDEVLSLNVFFVQAMSFGDGGAIGISNGLPGAAALHGTESSGVVFTSEFMGESFQERSGAFVDGDEYTGVVFAHEVGHYLGLYHTSEMWGQGYDPLADTPQCSGNSFPNDCDDLTNLMFPFAGVDHVVMTEDQAFVVGVSPLTKE